MCEADRLASDASPPSCSPHADFTAGFDLVTPKSHDVSIANRRRDESDRPHPKVPCLPTHPPTTFDEGATVETLGDDLTEWPAVLRGPAPAGRRPDDRETLERDLRARYDDCVLCGDGRQRGPEVGHAVVHYLTSPASPYDGPVTPANALMIRPNHRGDPEHGTATVDPRSLTAERFYEQSVDARRLLTTTRSAPSTSPTTTRSSLASETMSFRVEPLACSIPRGAR